MEHESNKLTKREAVVMRILSVKKQKRFVHLMEELERLSALKWTPGIDDVNAVRVKKLRAELAALESEGIIEVNGTLRLGPKGKRAKSTPRIPLQTVFDLVELAAAMLPSKTRSQAFEPAFHDAKADFLKMRRRHDSKVARCWITLCFAVHSALMMFQCVWGLCSISVQKLLLRALPELVKRLLS